MTKNISHPCHRPVTEAQLQHLREGGMIISTLLDCDLRIRDGRFVMTSVRTGRHSLDAGCTDLARLNAHWEGFCQNSRDAKIAA